MTLTQYCPFSEGVDHCSRGGSNTQHPFIFTLLPDFYFSDNLFILPAESEIDT